ncbi:MAG: MaoC family dehydratase [Candidatus Dormibacteraeota bacterium]|nr:MaoC family dehydratase [Candidatus Dormibacteraeota bacterium]
MKTIAGIEGYKALVGEQLGESDWLEIDQDRINQFADATGDHQWIHVDTDKANQGPFGTTIAHGFLTLSLVPALTGGLLKIDGVRMGINYGLNRVRFPAPVKVGSRVKASVRNVSVEDVQGGIQIVNEVTISVEGEAKPACVAETVTRLYV